MTPWVMTQRWNDLLFLHYEIAPEKLRPLVPEVLTLDTYQQRAWVSVTPFWMNHLRPPGSRRCRGSRIFPRSTCAPTSPTTASRASSSSASTPAIFPPYGEARIFYRLPYWQAAMKVKGRGGPKIEYRTKRSHGPKPAELRAPTGRLRRAFHARPGSLEHFLTERYCLYSVSRKRLYRADIHHLPWDLQPATVELELNTMAQTAGIELPADARSQRLLALL